MCDLSGSTLLKETENKRRKESIFPYFSSVRRHDEICLYVMLLKEGMPLVAEARFHLIVPVQTLQGGPCDVHLAGSTSRAEAVSRKGRTLRSQIIIPLIIFIGIIAPSACSKVFTAKKCPS